MAMSSRLMMFKFSNARSMNYLRSLHPVSQASYNEPSPAQGDFMSYIRIIPAFLSFTLLIGCSAGWHQQQVQGPNSGPADRLSAGTVQRSIHNGMSSADVITALGSPNLVSTDDQHREVWVYDKIATDVSYSNSNAFGTILILGASANSGSQSTNQRTLTIAVKFDESHKVRDFSYHQTSF